MFNLFHADGEHGRKVRCRIGGQPLHNDETLFIGENNRSSIVLCFAPKCVYLSFDPEVSLPERSTYSNNEGDERILGIRIDAFVNNREIHLSGLIGNNTHRVFTFQLNFTGTCKLMSNCRCS